MYCKLNSYNKHTIYIHVKLHHQNHNNNTTNTLNKYFLIYCPRTILELSWNYPITLLELSWNYPRTLLEHSYNFISVYITILTVSLFHRPTSHCFIIISHPTPVLLPEPISRRPLTFPLRLTCRS